MLPVLVFALLFAQQGPVKESLPGARNVTRVDANILCGGATSAVAYPELKKRGVVAVISLRRESEAGADIPGAKAAAEAAGVKYIRIPIDPAAVTPADADTFIKAVTDPANQPLYVHCGSANRVAAMWLIKRVVVDGWELPRATEEAVAIGLTRPELKQFAIDYATAHRRQP
jgi:uncharacterized protein (TIGR01244 family)